MPLVTSFGDVGAWTGHACTPENPCNAGPLPPACGPGSASGLPCQAPRPTTAQWTTPGSSPPAAPDPTAPAPASPAFINGKPFGVSLPADGQSAPGYSVPAAPLRIFGLPPLLVIGAGGLLVFLVARRL